MKIFVKRTLTALLSAAMAVMAITGCNGQSGAAPQSSAGTASVQSESSASEAGTVSNMTPAGEFPIVKEAVSLDIVAPGYSWFAPYDQMDFIKWYTEKTNVNVNFTTIPYETMKEKLNLMMTSGSIPDAFLDLEFGFSSSEITSYGSDGAFLALNDLINQYGVNFQAAAAQYDKSMEMIASADGKIYALPGFNDCLHCQYKQKMWVNQDWLSALNLEMPSTTAEFEAMLLAFKEQDPNGNRQKDEIPLMGYNSDDGNIAHFLLNAFTYVDGATKNTPFWTLNNGKVTFVANTEEYRQGVAWINSLTAKGLIDPTSFTQDNTQFQQVVRDPSGAKVGVIKSFNLTGITGIYTETDNHVVTQYAAMPVLKRPDGNRIQPSNTYSERVAPNKFVITSKCENPEVAFRWADGWYTDESSMNAWHGIEGIAWEKAGDGAFGLNGKPALYSLITLDAEAQKAATISNMLGNNTAALREGYIYDDSDTALKYSTDPVLYFATRDAYKPYAKPELTVPPLSLTPEESAEASSIETQLKDYVNENLALFCLGTKDIDKEWGTYVQEFSVLGIDRLAQIYQAAYDRQYQ